MLGQGIGVISGFFIIFECPRFKVFVLEAAPGYNLFHGMFAMRALRQRLFINFLQDLKAGPAAFTGIVRV
jgi:hypothetical protein